MRPLRYQNAACRPSRDLSYSCMTEQAPVLMSTMLEKLLAKKSSVQSISPTHAALEQHVKRAVFQGGHIWGQTLIPQPVLPSPSSWEWIKTNNGLYEPHWTTLPEASKTCFELVSCGCKKGCCSSCKCKKAALKCTVLCVCERECSAN